MIASRGSTARTSARMRSGRIGHCVALHRLPVAGDELFAVGRHLRHQLRAAATPLGAILRATRFSTVSAGLRSATAPISTG